MCPDHLYKKRISEITDTTSLTFHWFSTLILSHLADEVFGGQQ